jgi:hypothetical protein
MSVCYGLVEEIGQEIVFVLPGKLCAIIDSALHSVILVCIRIFGSVRSVLLGILLLGGKCRRHFFDIQYMLTVFNSASLLCFVVRVGFRKILQRLLSYFFVPVKGEDPDP